MTNDQIAETMINEDSIGVMTDGDILNAIKVLDKALKEYKDQNKIFLEFISRNGLSAEYDNFRRSWMPTSRTPISSMTADLASLCIVDDGISILYVDDNDYNHFYNVIYDVSSMDMSALYSPGGAPRSDYVALSDSEKWDVLVEIGRIMSRNEGRIERSPLLIEKTKDLAFAERYMELAAAVKGEKDVSVPMFQEFLGWLSDDCSKAMEAISELENEIKRIRTDSEAGAEDIDLAIEKVSKWAEYAGIAEELRPTIEELKSRAETNTQRFQKEADSLREEINEWRENNYRKELTTQSDQDQDSGINEDAHKDKKKKRLSI